MVSVLDSTACQVVEVQALASTLCCIEEDFSLTVSLFTLAMVVQRICYSLDKSPSSG